jgi:hypothetical protein
MERIDRLEEIAATLLEQARLSEQRFELADKRLDVHERQIAILRSVAQETNERIGALVSSIGDYIRHDMEKHDN